MTQILESIGFSEIMVGTVPAIITGWVTWFLSRRKYKAEVDSNVIENMKQSLEFYTRLSDDNKRRLDEALAKNEKLEKEVDELRKQVFELMQNVCYSMSCELREKKARKPKPLTTETEENNADKEGE